MSATSSEPSRRLLEPLERISEILFGLIMALTFTGSISVASDGHAEIRTILIGAIGCNLAWGIVDGVMYLITTLSERGRGITALRAVQAAASTHEAQRIIADALPPTLAAVLTPVEFDAMRVKLQQMPAPPARPQLRGVDYLKAAAILLLVFLSTFPVALPFVFMHDTLLAMRVSNGVAVLMLFAAGCALGRYAGQRPVRMGLAMVALGVVLVVSTIALGG